MEKYYVSALPIRTFHGMFFHWMGTILLLVTLNPIFTLTRQTNLEKYNDIFTSCLIFEVSSSLVDVPLIKYGYLVDKEKSNAWNWLDVPSPTHECSKKVYQFAFLNIL